MEIIHGDAGEVLRALGESHVGEVDLVVTSPPYFAQRRYGADAREVGAEDDPRQYVRAVAGVLARCAPLLAPHGSLFVVLGDKYNVDGPIKAVHARAGYPRAPRQPRWPGMSQKSLMLLPQRVALHLVDETGLALRAEIIWRKGVGGADGKAADRVRRAHEYVLHFTRRLRHGEAQPVWGPLWPSVWDILPRAGVEHPADLPEELAERIIVTWSPPGGLVLDPFCGSGTTLQVANRLGRRALGIELYGGPA